jgi:hypothetical protein
MEAENIYGIKDNRSLSKKTSDFINSNDIMSNVVFVLMLLVICIIIFNMCIELFLYIMMPTNSPHLIDGMVDTKDSEMKIIQDPSKSNSKTILISNNESEGLEFTWSWWIYVDDLDYRRGELKNVFVKGDNLYTNNSNEEQKQYNGVDHMINGPGVYLTPFENKLLFAFNTYDNVIEQFEIDNIPMNKWLNVIIRCEQRTIDVFINSAFAKRYKLKSLPKQNYNNVYIGKNGGFAGYVSNLWYYNYALGTKAINSLYRMGASTNILNDRSKETKGSGGGTTQSGLFGNFRNNFLSFRWFIE